MHDAPAPQNIDVVAALGEPREKLGTPGDMQGRLGAGVASAKGGDELGRDPAHLRVRGNAQVLGLRAPECRELGVRANEAVDQLVAGLEQRVPGAGEAKAPSLLLEQRHLERRRELLQLQRHGGLGEVQLLGRARDAAEAGDGLEYEELRQQPMAEESTRMCAGHLGSCSVTEVSLAAPRLEPADAAGVTGDVLRLDDHPAESYSPAGLRIIPETKK